MKRLLRLLWPYQVRSRKLPYRSLEDLMTASHAFAVDPRPQRVEKNNVLLTPEHVAERLCVSVDWVRDHSSRKNPRLPVIRLGGGPGRKGLLRYRASEIEKFISDLERLSTCGRGYNTSTPPIAAPEWENYGKEVVSKGLDSAQR